jgi:hypothetical protein
MLREIALDVQGKQISAKEVLSMFFGATIVALKAVFQAVSLINGAINPHKYFHLNFESLY